MKTLSEYAEEMKRDWDERAHENAKWFINTFKMEQTEEEFDASCLNDIQVNVLATLPALTWRRNPRQLRLLEIGCGIGRMSRHLAAIFGEVHGTDVSGEMVRQARERLKDLPNAFFYETNGVDFADFPANHFDVIFSAYVFQHMPDIEIIRANIREAFRVLAPGGVCKFVSAGISNSAYDAMPKNTWTGAPFNETNSRQIASELGAQLVSLQGEGTQYFWTTLRKPRPEVADLSALTLVAIGRADDLSLRDIPARGAQALLGLQVTGLSAETVDCNNLRIELQEKVTYPIYVGPPNVKDVTTKEALAGNGDDERVTQIHAPIPSEASEGIATVRLCFADGELLEAVINILPAVVPPPVVMQYSNALDAGLDIYTSGPKSVIRVFAVGFEGEVTVENTLMHIGELALQPEAVSFLPANGAWEIRAPLPAGTPAQETHISVSHCGRRSMAQPLVIQE